MIDTIILSSSLQQCTTLQAQSRPPQRIVSNIFTEKYFQLEELEDKETATTEIYLNADETVTLGKTDGPLPTKGKGIWRYHPKTKSFEMKLRRTFDSGKKSSSGDFHVSRIGAEADRMGEFAYDVERVYLGDLTEVGESLAVSGSIHLIDEKLGDEKVGFFNMVDTQKN